MDAQGRILLPQYLRDFASLDKRVAFVGQGSKFELWDEPAWNARNEAALVTTRNRRVGDGGRARILDALRSGPFSDQQHLPVLLEESVHALVVDPNGIYVDGTFGRGGHSRAILARLSDTGRLIAFDRDPEAVSAGRILARGGSAVLDPSGRFGSIGSACLGRPMCSAISVACPP
jgi:hypothetical protein